MLVCNGGDYAVITHQFEDDTMYHFQSTKDEICNEKKKSFYKNL